MYIAFIVVTVLAAAANLYAAMVDFTCAPFVVANMTRLGVADWSFQLGALKALGGCGLLVGIAVPLIGLAAGAGLVLFFVGAIVVVLRARWYAHLSYPTVWLALAVAALSFRLVVS